MRLGFGEYQLRLPYVYVTADKRSFMTHLSDKSSGKCSDGSWVVEPLPAQYHGGPFPSLSPEFLCNSQGEAVRICQSQGENLPTAPDELGVLSINTHSAAP